MTSGISTTLERNRSSHQLTVDSMFLAPHVFRSISEDPKAGLGAFAGNSIHDTSWKDRSALPEYLSGCRTLQCSSYDSRRTGFITEVHIS